MTIQQLSDGTRWRRTTTDTDPADCPTCREPGCWLGQLPERVDAEPGHPQWTTSPCPTCNPDELDEDQWAEAHSPTWERDDCHNCGGLGYRWNVRCLVCGGTGALEYQC